MNLARATTTESVEPAVPWDVTRADLARAFVGADFRLHRADVLAGSGGTVNTLSGGTPGDFPHDATGVAVLTARVRRTSIPRGTAAAGPVAQQALAEWQGMVVEVGESNFVAELQGKIGQGVNGSLEEARIPLSEVSPEDRELLRPGAFFRLCITRELTPEGSLRRYTQVVFRRMPAYRREDLEAARAEAMEIVRELRVE